MHKCEFNPGEPCHPLACLTRSTAAYCGLEAETHSSAGKDEKALRTIDTLHTIMMHTSECALKKMEGIDEATNLFKY